MLFQKRSVGVDVADRSIEIVEFAESGGRVRVKNLARTLLPPGMVEHGRIQKSVELAQILSDTLRNAKPAPITTRTVVFGVPESQVYTHLFRLPVHKKEERDSLVLKEATTSIPLKGNILLYAYRILSENKNGAEVLLVATERDVLIEWQSLFSSIGIAHVLFDIETLAVFRGLFTEPPQDPVCIVDAGTRTTTFSFFNKDGLRYTHSLSISGSTITYELSKTLKLRHEEAEKLKIEEGLRRPEGKAFPVIVKVLESIVTELAKSRDFFESVSKERVQEVVLVGGASRLKGLAEYFNANLNVPVRAGVPVLLGKRVPLEYVEAAGLALRGLIPSWDKRDPILSLTQGKEGASHGPRGIFDFVGRLSMRPKSVSPRKKNASDTSSLRPVKASPLPTKEAPRSSLLWILLLLISIALGSAVLFVLYFRFGSETVYEAPSMNVMKERVLPMPSADPIDEGAPVVPREGAKLLRQKIEILETPTGWLNVREGPGISFERFDRVYPQESYPLLDEEDGWYRIELYETSFGWVTSQYAIIR